MSSKLNVESFVAVLKKSGLIEQDRLQRLVADYTAQGGTPDDSARLAEFLVANNAITRWQSEKLLQGKHKGYFLGKYRLLSLLGKGGMSSVYLAEHVLMRRRCALKVLPTKRVHDSSYLARFHREAQAVASLDHPNIVRAYDVDHQVDRDTEIHFLVMEYVEGFSLQELVQNDGLCDFFSAAEYIRQAALGLHNAHEAGMVHRDVKPGNLLVDPNGVVKVLDLGLARFFTGDEDEDALTIRHDEKVLGTADYLAPEQALDSHTVDARADIYGLGCTFYFLLTGRPPFTEGTLAQRLMAHQTKAPPTIESLRPETPVSLGNIIRKMMAKKADDRYATAKDVADALFIWLDNNVDHEWRKSHSGIFGVQSAADRASPPMAQPIMARPVVVEPVVVAPAPQVAHPPIYQSPPPQFAPPVAAAAQDTVPTVDPELSSFFAALSDSQGAPAAAVAPKPPVAAPKNPAPQIEAVVPPHLKSPSSRKLKNIGINTTEFPVQNTFPDFSVSQPAPPPTPVPKAKSSAEVRTPKKTKPLPFKLPFKLPPKPVLAGIGGGAVVLLLLIFYFMSGGNGSQPRKNQQTLANLSPWPSDKREVTVGEGGEYKSISDALKAVRRRFEPSGPTDQIVLKVEAGTYHENISVDGTVKRYTKQEKKNLKFIEPDWPQGVKVVGGAGVILEPGPDAPAIRLKNVSRFIMEGITVKAAALPIALEIAGDMNESVLSDMRISGFTQTGISCLGARGISFGNSQFILQKLILEPAAGSNSALGIRLNKGDDGDPSDVIIRGCQFLGPMAAGVTIAGAGPYRILIAENIFAKTQDGIRCEGAAQWKDMAIANNTFFEDRNGIVFTQMPSEGSQRLSFRRNLFAKMTAAEGMVQSSYDEGRFTAMLANDRPGAGFNFSDRAKPPSPTTGEINFLCEGSGKRGEKGITFVSTESANAKFLAPAEGSVQKSVPGAGEGEKNWVGAVGP